MRCEHSRGSVSGLSNDNLVYSGGVSIMSFDGIPAHAGRSWDDVFVQPLYRNDNWQTIVLSCLCFFGVQLLTRIVFNQLSPKFRGLDAKAKSDFCVRSTATAHSMIACLTIPMYMRMGPEQKLDLYQNTTVGTILCVSVGYFLWDLTVCIYFNWGMSWVVHAVTSIGLFYTGLYPFQHYQAAFYLGFFEVSTVGMHVRSNLVALGYPESSAAVTASGLFFFVTFTVNRIVLGTLFSLDWWPLMLHLLMTGKAHSDVVIVFSLFGNVLLMGLNYFWWIQVLRTLMGVAPPPKLQSDPQQDAKKKSS